MTDDRRYRDDYRYRRDYDTEDDGFNWGGLLSLLLIPLLALGVWWAWNAYKNHNNTAYNNVVNPVNTTSPTPKSGVQVGVGGGPVTPTMKVSISPSPSPSVSPATGTTSNGSGLQQGVGGSAYTGSSSSLPSSGPQTGFGGVAQ